MKQRKQFTNLVMTGLVLAGLGIGGVRIGPAAPAAAGATFALTVTLEAGDYTLRDRG